FSGDNKFHDLTINDGTAEIKGNNSYNNLTIVAPATEVKFGANKTQTVNGIFKSAGADTDNPITLTTNAAVPKIEDEEDYLLTWWKLAGIPEFASWTETKKADFSYTNIEYCTSEKSLVHDWGADVKESTEASTHNIFIRGFYWIGGTDTNWKTPSNWKYSPTATETMSFYPPYEKGKSDIVIYDNADNVLKLTDSVVIKTLVINENKSVDFADKDVTATKITNNGRVKMTGTNTITVTTSPNLVSNGTAATSTVEYYGDCSTIPWGTLYTNLEFSDGANASISNDLTINGATAIYNGAANTLSLLGDNTFKNTLTLGTGTTAAGTITVNGNYNSKPVEIDNAGDVTLSGTNLYIASMEDSEICNTLTVESEATINGQVISNTDQTYKDVITLANDATLLAGAGTVDFQKEIVNASAKALTIGNTLNATNTHFEGAVGTEEHPLDSIYVEGNLTAEDVIYGASTSVKGTSSLSGNVTTTGTQVYSGAVTWNEEITLDARTAYVQFNTGATPKTGLTDIALSIPSVTYLTGSGNFGGGKGIIIGSPEANKNLFVGVLTNGQTLTVTDNVIVNGNMFVSSQSSSTGILEIDSPLSVMDNFALYNGNVKVTGTGALNVTKDILLYNGTDILDDVGAQSSNQNIFVYNLADRPVAISLADSAIPSSLPDGTAINTSYSSTLSPIAGAVIHAGQNFFDNGVNLNGTGNWTLELKDNTDSHSAFAEIYNASIANCQVSPIDDGDDETTEVAYLAAAEATDGSGNSNVWFTRPNISAAATVYDDVIRISFDDGNGNPLNIENTNNEIYTEFTTRAWYSNNNNAAGSQITFQGTYTDPECTTSTTDAGNLSTFYLRVAAEDSWNTDATGISSGVAESTDRNRNHKTSVPYINLPKTLTVSYLGLRDEHKNRVGNYYTATPNLTAANASFGKTYTATADECAPVLNFVKTGQEKHVAPGKTADIADLTQDAQKVYDAHNFIEFIYSEPVNIGNGTNTMNYNNGDVNFGSNAVLGDIIMDSDPDSVSPFLAAGLASFAAGNMDADTKVPGNPVNALYRNYDEGSGTEKNQTHRVRLSIAGYVDGTISPIGSTATYYNWTSYINHAAMPTGIVTRVQNDYLTDRAGNKIIWVSAENHELPEITVDAGSWDVTPPEFVPLRLNNGFYEWTPELKDSTSYEAVGADESGSGTLKTIEFHMFDNAPSYDGTDPDQWFTKMGWFKSTDNIRADLPAVEVAADTRGGIRYSSLYDLTNKFSYKVQGTATELQFDTANSITCGATNTLFKSSLDGAKDPGAEDGCYFKVPLPFASNHEPKTTFDVTYKAEGSKLTDLAGNVFQYEEFVIHTVDRSAPVLNMTAAPYGKKEMYVAISKAINTSTVYGYRSGAAGDYDVLNALDMIPTALKVVESSGAASSVLIDTSVPARVVHKTSNTTGFIITLQNEVDWNAISGNLYLQVVATDTYKYDSFSGIENSPVTFIQDEVGNYAEAGKQHAFTDFAVNVVEPEYAYNIDMKDDKDNELQFGLYEDGSWAVHSWGKEQGNYGTLNPKFDVLLKVKDENNLRPVMRTSDAPSANSESVEYNRVTGRDWRIWLPEIYTNIAPELNSNLLSVSSTDDPDDTEIRNYTIPVATDPAFSSYQNGDTISFLFNTGATVRHNGSTDVESPLYALRLEDENDVSSLDLWSFKLKDIITQRGGVSVLNNVINPLNGEKAVIRLDMPSSGKVNIIVMTLDGNVVTYVNRGDVASGEQFFTWDGRNTAGTVVARGMYFVRIVGNGIDETRKIMIIK
ncbi:MAG: hypothetical protein MJ179_08815, partial [Treponema sp.]|nr:hypothetical protein [Treponema sp.]